MQVVLTTVLIWILRRVRPMTLALAAYETWRRLPRAQRRKLLLLAGRHAPKVAALLVRRARPAR